MQTNINAIRLHITKLGRSRFLSGYLGALVSFAASLMPLGVSLAQAADALGDRVTTKPTGNRAVDAVLTELQFSPLKTMPQSGSLALLSGPGGNMTVLAGPAGALPVDTGIHATAESVAKAAEAFAGKPVITVINTHWHFDHAGGNEWFARHGARIIAHDSARARMSHPQPIEMLNFTFPAAPVVALPFITLPDTLTLYHGDETLRLQHVAPAHTDKNLLVHFAAANVLATGDVFFHGFYPHIDYSSRGWIGGWLRPKIARSHHVTRRHVSFQATVHWRR